MAKRKIKLERRLLTKPTETGEYCGEMEEDDAETHVFPGFKTHAHTRFRLGEYRIATECVPWGATKIKGKRYEIELDGPSVVTHHPGEGEPAIVAWFADFQDAILFVRRVVHDTDEGGRRAEAHAAYLTGVRTQDENGVFHPFKPDFT